MTSNEISIERFFLILRTHAWLVLGFFVAGVVLASVVTWLTPAMYTATSSLNFDFKNANPIDSQGRTLESDNYLYTQMDVIQSLNVAKKVEKNLTDYERERFIDSVHDEKTVLDDAKNSIVGAIKSLGVPDKKSRVSRQGAGSLGEQETINIKSAYSWFAQIVGRNLSVEPRLKSRIVDISYASTNPRIAALMANKFAEAYLATNLDMTIDPARKTSLWFDEQLKTLRAKLESAQSALTAYQQQQGIVSSDQRMDTESARLRELSSQLVKAQQSTREAVFAQKKLKEIQQRNVPLTRFSPIFSNPVVTKIKGEIRKLEGELVDLSASLGKNHPRYKRVSSELGAARNRLQTEISTITDGINNNAELAKEREADLSAAVEAQKQLVLNLKKEHDKIAILEREVESANKTYNAALAELNTTSMKSLVNQTNVYIVDPANIPRQRSSPLFAKNLLLGAFGGLLFGIGLAILMELFIRRVHSKEDLLLELKIPCLGHLNKA
ncbi:Signal transduction histidine kinase CheA [hydrothermal vent metagenome]|uniref:Signal transduction histidine kinase CheA n=1 Tax=hydrothermal vent metagenome TaxID=652676 RepID=A0A3B0YN87_9ZZZZ